MMAKQVCLQYAQLEVCYCHGIRVRVPNVECTCLAIVTYRCVTIVGLLLFWTLLLTLVTALRSSTLSSRFDFLGGFYRYDSRQFFFLFFLEGQRTFARAGFGANFHFSPARAPWLSPTAAKASPWPAWAPMLPQWVFSVTSPSASI